MINWRACFMQLPGPGICIFIKPSRLIRLRVVQESHTEGNADSKGKTRVMMTLGLKVKRWPQTMRENWARPQLSQRTFQSLSRGKMPSPWNNQWKIFLRGGTAIALLPKVPCALGDVSLSILPPPLETGGAGEMGFPPFLNFLWYSWARRGILSGLQ